MKLSNKLMLVMFTAFSLMLSSCDKTKPYDTILPGSAVHFVGAENRSILVDTDPAPSDTIQVGTTDVSSTDRTVTYNVTSPSGAVAGVDYTISTGAPSGTVVIPAGQALANIVITPIFGAFPPDSRDTLYFTLSEPSIPVAQFLDTVRVILRGVSSAPCSEDNPTMADFLGLYDNTNEDFGGAYGPYPTTITSATVLTATTARIDVENIFDTGWGPIGFTLNWTDPANPTTTVIAGDVPGSDAGDINSTYAGILVMVRVHATGGPTTYSYCNQTLTLRMQLGVSGVGWFAPVYTVTMAR
jgi:hypothetical protein